MEPARALERIAYLLDRAREKPYRVRAYLRAAEIVKALAPDELVARVVAGTLDEDDDVLERLDVVVASVHSKLRMEKLAMTRRMITAIADPHTDVLGHCTGRYVVGRGRPQSEFDAEVVFRACERFGTAVEINSRPERLDPPNDLLALAVEIGCRFAINTDAHAPGQLEWQPYGADKAAETGLTIDRVVNSWSTDKLLGWTQRLASHTKA